MSWYSHKVLICLLMLDNYSRICYINREDVFFVADVCFFLMQVLSLLINNWS